MLSTRVVSPRPPVAGLAVAGLRLQNGRLIRFADHGVPLRSIIIGRDPRCDVVIDDPTISRRHCRIEAVVGGYAIEDCGSENGIHVATLGPGDRYRRIGWEALALGSHLLIGEVEATPMADDESSPVLVVSHSAYLRHVDGVYTSDTQIERHVGLTRRVVHKLLRGKKGR